MNAQSASSAAHERRSLRGGRKVRRYLPAAVIVVEVLVLIALTIRWFPALWAVGWAVFDLDQSAGPETGVTMSEVANHPEAMWGRTVTVSAEVDDIAGDHAMIIGTEALFRGFELLVVAPMGFAALTGEPLVEERVAQVTGEVRLYEPAALEAEFGPRVGDALGGQEIAEYDGKAVLVARQINLDLPDTAHPGDAEFGDSAGYDIGLTMYDITQDTEKYLGETVTLSDEVEEGLLTPHVFWIGDEKLLVVSPEPVPEAFVEATAYVTGEVRRFDLAQIEATTGVDLDDERLREYGGEPVIVAEFVHIVA